MTNHIYRDRLQVAEDRVKQLEAMIPWTQPGAVWFTLFWPATHPSTSTRAPEKLFICDRNGTHCVCTLGPDDWVFVGRRQKS